jgi:mono/diheme cytochrome c family protein
MDHQETNPMIRKVLLWLGVAVLLIVVILVVAISMRWNRRFQAPYPNVAASRDPAILARGRYLAYGPAHCSDCHTAPADYASLETGSSPSLSGGLEFPIPLGTIRVPNLTSDSATGIGRRSDGELARMLRYGVRADGRAAIPFMEYHELSDADLVALVSFLRTQPAVRHPVPDHDLNLLGKAVMAFAIKPVGPTGTPPAESPPSGPTLARGEYLVTAVANCAGCHTQRSMVTGEYTGRRLAGGAPMEAGDKAHTKLVPPDITGDSTGRAAVWTEDEFVARFHAGVRIPGSPMPWQAFRRITDDDARAIYRYLRSLRGS